MKISDIPLDPKSRDRHKLQVGKWAIFIYSPTSRRYGEQYALVVDYNDTYNTKRFHYPLDKLEAQCLLNYYIKYCEENPDEPEGS